MNFTVIRFRRPALAAAVALCFGAPALVPAIALAQNQAAQVLAPVVITGARFDSAPSLAPIGTSVISSDEIRRAGVADLNAAIRKIGGVYGRQSLDGSPDFGLDLRGFGTNSSQNLVVVLDGVRLSDNELSNAILSTIPVDSVERIEITRGGSSVLYGEGATGGVIDIVTKRPAQNSSHGSMLVEGGQFGAGDVRGSYAQAWNSFAADATLGHQRTDNYRGNNDFKLSNFSAGLQWFDRDSRTSVRYDGARQDSGLAGSLTEAQFQTNPRQTLTGKDHGSLDSDRLTGSYSRRLGAWDIAAELSHREKTARADYFYSFGESRSTYHSKQDQFSPRVRHLGELAGMLNELVAGVDLMRWTRNTDASFSQADASQRSKAVYLRDELRFDAEHDGRISAGVRRELFDKNSYDPAPYTTANYHTNQGLNAWELQATYAPVTLLDVYAKAGHSYRVANSDENAYTPNVNVPLQPQVSHDLELGASYGDAQHKVTARVFQHKLRNEIFYDPTLNGGYGANTNLDPTRRQGFELDAEAMLARDWSVNAHYQHVQAKFMAGVNAGKQMVLVPRNVLTARLSWLPANGQSADVGVQWVDAQRYGSDFDNSCKAQMPAYTTFDARYARKFGQWEVAVAGLNLGDKQYFSQAFGCQAGIYPADGRQLKLSARYDF
ncbi:MAG: TonB-dependent receptor family protein [Sphingomonadaceae bacterium]